MKYKIEFQTKIKTAEYAEMSKIWTLCASAETYEEICGLWSKLLDEYVKACSDWNKPVQRVYRLSEFDSKWNVILVKDLITNETTAQIVRS